MSKRRSSSLRKIADSKSWFVSSLMKQKAKLELQYRKAQRAAKAAASTAAQRRNAKKQSKSLLKKYSKVIGTLAGIGTTAAAAYGASKLYNNYNLGHPPNVLQAHIKSGKASQIATKASSDATRKAHTTQKALDYKMKKAAQAIQNKYHMYSLRQLGKGLKTASRESGRKLMAQTLKNKTKRQERGILETRKTKDGQIEIKVLNKTTDKPEWVQKVNDLDWFKDRQANKQGKQPAKISYKGKQYSPKEFKEEMEKVGLAARNSKYDKSTKDMIDAFGLYDKDKVKYNKPK